MSEGLRARAVHRGDFRTDVYIRDHKLRVDEPVELNGDNTGPMPTELLAASLASCFALALGWVARKRSIELPGLEVEVKSVRAGTELRYGRLEVGVTADLPDEQLQPLIERAERFCWVTNTLNDPPTITYSIQPRTTSPEVS